MTFDMINHRYFLSLVSFFSVFSRLILLDEIIDDRNNRRMIASISRRKQKRQLFSTFLDLMFSMLIEDFLLVLTVNRILGTSYYCSIEYIELVSIYKKLFLDFFPIKEIP